jgi:hypothetical protein
MVRSLPIGPWSLKWFVAARPESTREKLMRVARLARVVCLGLVIAAALVTTDTRSLGAQQPAQTKPIPLRVADTSQVQVIRLRDGSSIVGRVTEIGTDTVQFATSSGTLAIPRADIVEVREVAKTTMRSGEVWPSNPNATRLLFAPTGRMLEKREGYFNDTYLFLLSVHGGLSSRFSLGGGLSVLPLDDFTDNALFIMPKIGVVATPKFNLAVGALAGFVGAAFDEGENGSFGVLYAVGTAGSPDASISFGTGLAYAGSSFADRPVAMLGGEARISRRIALVSENYIIPNDDVPAIVSYGVRFFGEKLSADLAFWLGPEDITFPGIPYVAFSVKF